MNSIVVTYKTLQDESKVRNLIKEKYEYEVIPVPRQISVTCGIAHRINCDEFEYVSYIINDLFKKGELPNVNVHFYEDLGNNEYKSFVLD